MSENPVLAYTGPESNAQDISIVLYDGTAATVRGTVADAETMPAEAAQTWANAGALAWIAYDGDPTRIEFVEYTDAAGQRLHRRCIKGERVGSRWNTCKLNLTAESANVEPASFSAADFGADFNAG